jgi:Photosynthetic reaction centre cytochrome C subunit
MTERVPAAVAAVSSIVILVYACATAPPTTNPTPTQQPAAGQQMPGGPPGGPRVPLTDSARRVRDSLNAARRDSASAAILRSIAGRENQPAESVFKNIKILKGVPAGRLVNIMNMGFGRSLGVSCGFCHVPGKWDLDDKEEKNTARLMFAMVQTINRDSTLSSSGRATATTGRAIAGWPLLLSLLEQLAKSRQLLRVENCFDLLVGAIPDGAHLGRWASPSRTAACAIGRRTTTTPAPTAPSTPPSTAPSPALTAPVFSEVFHRHCFVGEHPADFGLLRGIEL